MARQLDPDVLEVIRRQLILCGHAAVPRRKLTLARVNVNWDAIATSVSNLEELEITYFDEQATPSLPQLKAVLSTSPNLLYLTVQGHVPRCIGADQEPYIELPHLTHLTISAWDVDMDHLTHFFDFIRCPSLTSFALKAERKDLTTSPPILYDPEPMMERIVHQHRMQCHASGQHSHTAECHIPSIPLSTLQFLVLDGILARPERILSFLDECTSLKQLDLQRIHHEPAAEIVRNCCNRFTVMVDGEDGRGLLRGDDLYKRVFEPMLDREEREDRARGFW